MIPTLCAIRFGTGLAPDIAPPDGPADLLARLGGPDTGADVWPPDSWEERAALLQAWGRARRRRREGEAEMEAYRAINRTLRATYHDDLLRTLVRAATTRDGFRERLTWFWAGHFAVTEGGGALRKTVTPYHETAIRPYVTGRFATLLKAAVTHPAMVSYLDQRGSAGPNSPRGRRGGGLNENLAREVLELHTLGVDGGYSQADVGQLAELLTGLDLARDGTARFNRNLVEPGPEVVLGQSYGGPRPNRHDVDAVLDDLAMHPATARHVSRKLAAHFVADAPPGDMVEAMARAWMATQGDLMAVYAAMLDQPAAWDPELRKVRQPFDMIAAAVRATGAAAQLTAARARDRELLLSTPLARMGQPFQRPAGPDGWPEEAQAWITPQGLAARIDWAMGFADWLDPAPDPRALVETALGPLADGRLRFAAGAAEDRAAGIGLILASPAFQRR